MQRLLMRVLVAQRQNRLEKTFLSRPSCLRMDELGHDTDRVRIPPYVKIIEGLLTADKKDR